MPRSSKPDERLTLKSPQWLNPEGKKYWARNAPALLEANVLTDASYDDFCLLCQVYGYMRQANPTDSKERIWYLGLLKQYQPLRKLFKLEDKAESIADIIREGLTDAE